MMAPEPYQPVFSNGELSAPVGKVPHAIQATFLAAKQHTDAEALFNFLCDPANDLSELYGVHEDGCYAALIALPTFTDARGVIYCFGRSRTSLTNLCKLLALYGEEVDLGGCPPVLLLLASVCMNHKNMKNPSHTDDILVFKEVNHLMVPAHIVHIKL